MLKNDSYRLLPRTAATPSGIYNVSKAFTVQDGDLNFSCDLSDGGYSWIINSMGMIYSFNDHCFGVIFKESSEYTDGTERHNLHD